MHAVRSIRKRQAVIISPKRRYVEALSTSKIGRISGETNWTKCTIVCSLHMHTVRNIKLQDYRESFHLYFFEVGFVRSSRVEWEVASHDRTQTTARALL